MVDARFRSQMELMILLLPHILREEMFALKGGTAINLFFRPLPRLSIDIDLTYLPLESREKTLTGISEGLDRFSERILRTVSGIRRVARRRQGDHNSALVVEGVGGVVKVEPNAIIRGSVFQCTEKEFHPGATKYLGAGAYVKAKTLSFADLYGGKICAALDRQHPRDLFDIHWLLQDEGISTDIRKAFLVYLVSHDRPMRELLDPRPKELRTIFESELEGMMRVRVPLSTIEKTLPRLVNKIKSVITDEEKRFLISFKEGNPLWERLGVPGIEKLPAPAWKLKNILKMDPEKHKRSVLELKRVLDA